MGITIRDIDHGFKAMKALKGAKMKVGLVGERAEATHAKFGGTVLALGLIHEYGAGNVPARPFLGATFDANRDKYLGKLKSNAGNVFASAAGGLGLLVGAAKFTLAFGGALGLTSPGSGILSALGGLAGSGSSGSSRGVRSNSAPTRKALSGVGKQMAEDIVRKIRARIPPPLAPGTVRSKERSGAQFPDTPLIDTEELIRAIGYQVDGHPAVYVVGNGGGEYERGGEGDGGGEGEGVAAEAAEVAEVLA